MNHVYSTDEEGFHDFETATSCVCEPMIDLVYHPYRKKELLGRVFVHQNLKDQLRRRKAKERML